MQKLCMNIDSNFDENLKLLEKIYNKDQISICFEYASNFENAKILRDYIFHICNGIGVNPTWRSRFILITDELNNNAIEYGSSKGDINKMIFRLSKENSKLKIQIEIVDTGRGIETKTAMEMKNLREYRKKVGFKNHHSIRGRGLFMIIDNIVDKLYFKNSKDGGLIVGIEKIIEL